MSDTQFDNFFNDKLKDHEASVPSGLWDKLKDAHFDHFIGDKLKDQSAPVPEGLWDKITDGQFDTFIAGKLFDHAAPVPEGLWDKVTDGQFDTFIAGKLFDHTAPIPEGLWDKVKPEQDKDRKVGFVFPRYMTAALLILALLLGGTLGGYLFLKHGKEGATGTNEIILQQPVLSNGNKEKPVTPSSTNTHLDNSPAPVDSRTKNQSVTDKTAEILPSSSNEKNNHTEAPIINNTLVLSNEKKATGLKQGNNRLNKNALLFNQDLSKANSLSNNNLSVITNSGDQTTIEENSFDFIEPYNNTKLAASPVPFSIERDNLLQKLSDKQLSTANHTNQFKNVIICPSDRRNRNTDWFLEAYASPDMPFKSVNNISATQQYLLTKDSAESMQVSYSAGLRLVKPISDNLLLKVGLQYSQINQKYVYRTENEVKTTTVVTVRTIIRAPGDTVIVKDTSTLQQIGFKNNTVRNRYRSFDIPVTLGYQFGNEDTKFGINAGVIINLSSWYQGSVLDTSLASVTLNKNGNGVFKSNIGLGLYAGFSVVKKLSDDMHVFVEPYFRYNLSSMTSAQAKFNQKFSLGGISVGLRLNLNRK